MDTARDTLKTRLEAELDALFHRRSKIEAHLHNADREVPADWADRAQLFENDEVLEALDGRTRARIVQIKLALDRLHDPDWGTCVRCNEPIHPGRLAALPTTMICRSCAETIERS